MDFETWLEKNYRRLRKNFRPKPEGKCLTDEEMASLLDNQLNSKQRKAFLRHLASCSPCVQSYKEGILLAKALESKPLLEIPEHLIEKAKSLFPTRSPSNFLEIVLNFSQDAIELIRTTGKIMSSASSGPALRADKEPESFKPIKIEKKLEKLIIEVEIQKKRSAIADIFVKVTEKEKRKGLEDFRISLLKEGRELRSKIAEKGKVKFEGIKTGEYQIVIIKEENVSATIHLTIHPAK